MTRFCVVDFETTGTDPAVDRVVELAVVPLDDDLASGEPYQELYHPGARGMPPEAQAVHHISMEDLRFASEFNTDAWETATAGASVFVAHHAAFDRNFAPSLDPRPWVCTMKLALSAWADAPGYGNQVLRYYRGLSVELPEGLYPHRATYDALVTAALFRALHFEYAGDIERMIKVSSEPALLPRVRVGQHRGKKWSEVDAGYLRWVLSKDFDEDTKFTARHWLLNRGITT